MFKAIFSPILSMVFLSSANIVLGQDTLPTGGNVALGTASITSKTPTTLQIDQTSQNAVINWNSFSIGKDSVVYFNQPGDYSNILNRVTGDTSSAIAGRIVSNGRVYLVNPNGILISPTGVVNTGGFVASTLDITNDDFMAGRLNFVGKGNSASVSNSGKILGSPGSFIALLGGSVSNSGLLQVPLGKIGVGSAERITLDIEGDGFLQVAIPTSNADSNVAISQTGTISADGGLVELKASTAQETVRKIVNVSGSISAKSVSGRNGSINLDAGEAGELNVSGRISSSSHKKQNAGSIALRGDKVKILDAKITAKSRGIGGSISVAGRDIEIENSLLTTSGALGGGKITVGGDRQGVGTFPHAESVRIDSSSLLMADAVNEGNGGEIVIWSDVATAIGGTLSARGGNESGDGGLIETSSKGTFRFIDQTVNVDAGAKNGSSGLWIIDPQDLEINDVGASNIVAALNNGTNVNASTSACNSLFGGCSGSNGDITINSAMTWSGAAQLSLTADNNIIINAALNSSSSASSIVLNSSGTGGISGSSLGSIGTAGSVTLNVSNSSANGTILGAISGTGGIIKSGAGTVVFGGANAYTGATSINNGTLYIGSGGLGTLGLGQISIASAGRLFFNSTSYQGGSVIASALSGAGIFEVGGSSSTSTIRYSGDASAFSGQFIVDANARLGLYTSIASSSNADYIVNGLLTPQSSNITLYLGSISGTGSISQGGGATNSILDIGGNGKSTAFTGKIGNVADSIQIRKSGTGTTTLSANNTYTSGTFVVSGTLQIGDGITGNLPGSATISAGATLALNLASGTTVARSFANSGTISFIQAGTLTMTGSISGTGNLTQSSAGSTTISAANSLTGGASVYGGTLIATNANSLGSGPIFVSGTGATLNSSSVLIPNAVTYGTVTGSQTGTVVQGYGTWSSKAATAGLYANGTAISGCSGTGGTCSTNLTLSNGASTSLTAIGATSAWTISSVISSGNSSSSLIIGSGFVGNSLTLKGASTFTGSTVIAQGMTVILGSATGFGSASAAGLTNNGVVDLNGYSVTIGALSGSGTVTNSSAANITFTVGNSNSSTFSGNIQNPNGTISLVKTGSGILTLSGTNSYVGTTTINAGTLDFGGRNSLYNAVQGSWNASNISVAAGATIALSTSGANPFTSSDLSNIASLGTVSGGLKSGSFVGIDTGTSAFTYAGTFANTNNGGNSIGVVKLGSGTLLLTANQTYTGGTTVSAGTLQIGNGSTGSIAASSATSIASGSTLTLNLVDGAAFSNSVANAGNLNFSQAGALTFSGAISGAGSVAMSGSGTTTLTGVNSYTGATSVSAGIMSLNGSWDLGASAAAISVNQGATLNGSGRITVTSLNMSGLGTVNLSGENSITNLSSTGVTGSIAIRNSKTLNVGSFTAGSISLYAAGSTSDLVILPGASLSAAAAGTPVILGAGRYFINNAGSTGVVTSSSAYWQIFSASPLGDFYNGLDSGNTPVWGTNFGQTVSQSGNRYIFSYSPTLTISSVSDTKIYGTDATSKISSDYVVTGLQAGVTAAYLGDSLQDSVSGAPSLTSAGAVIDASVSGGPYQINVGLGSLTSPKGYSFAFISGGTLTIGKAALTVAGSTSTRTYNGSSQANTFTTVGLLGTDSVDSVAGLAIGTNVGTYSDVLSSANGTGLANYNINYVNGSLTINKATFRTISLQRFAVASSYWILEDFNVLMPITEIGQDYYEISTNRSANNDNFCYLICESWGNPPRFNGVQR